MLANMKWFLTFRASLKHILTILHSHLNLTEIFLYSPALPKDVIENRDVERIVKQISETKDSLQDLNTIALKEYIFLEEIISLLQQTTKKNISPIILKSIRQKVQKIVKQISRRERLFEKRRLTVWKFLEPIRIELPPTLQSQLLTQTKNIEVTSALLVKQFSKKDGLFIKDTLNVIDDPLSLNQLLAKAQDINTNGVKSCIAGFNNLLQWFNTQQVTILLHLREKYNLTVNLNAVSSLVGTPIRKNIVLLDADFVSAMEQKRREKDKTGYLLTFPIGDIIIPDKVLNEMSHIPVSKKAPLVSKQTINYLRSLSSIENVRPTSLEIQTITNTWLNTPKGRSTNQTQQQYFQQSGDMMLLVRALREKINPVFIFSNDNDISATINIFHQQRQAVNISVYRYEEAVPGSLRKVA